MYAEHSPLQIVAQVMLAFLFLYRGLDALPRFESHATKLRERSVPFAGFVLACGLAILVVGGMHTAARWLLRRWWGRP